MPLTHRHDVSVTYRPLTPAAEGAAPNGETADDSEWWRSCIPDDMQFEDISLSGKLSLLDQLLVKCENIGDKL